MTSLDRLHQAMTPGEDGRLPALSSEAVKASLGRYGVSAAEQLLSARVGTELNSSAKSAMDAITNPEIKALFEKNIATYQRIFEGGGITMPAPEELAAGGIDWAYLAELKETHSDHDLVVAPLTLPLEQLRDLVASVTNDQSIPNNPLKKYSQTKDDSDGLFTPRTNVDRWNDTMASTVKEWQLPVAELELPWTAFLVPSSNKPEHLGTSFQSMKQQGLSTTSITGHIAYQMRRITEGQPPVEAGGCQIWTLGEFVDGDGDACAPQVYWSAAFGQVFAGWSWTGDSFDGVGIRPPIG